MPTVMIYKKGKRLKPKKFSYTDKGVWAAKKYAYQMQQRGYQTTILYSH